MDRRTTKKLDGEYVDNDILTRFLALGKFVFDRDRMTEDNFHYLVEVQSTSTLKVMNRYSERAKGISQLASAERFSETNISFAARSTPTSRFPMGLLSPLSPRRPAESAAAPPGAAAGSGGSNKDYDASQAHQGINFGVSSSYLLPFFASGLGFPTGVFDILPGQSYFNPGTLRFLDALVGHHINGDLPDARGFPASLQRGCTLRRSPVPKEFMRKHKDNPIFEALFFYLLSSGNVPFALYRTDDITMNHYVAVSPERSTRIKCNDLIFLIAPHRGTGGKTPVRSTSPMNVPSLFPKQGVSSATKMAQDLLSENTGNQSHEEDKQLPPSPPKQKDTAPPSPPPPPPPPPSPPASELPLTPHSQHSIIQPSESQADTATETSSVIDDPIIQKEGENEVDNDGEEEKEEERRRRERVVAHIEEPQLSPGRRLLNSWLGTQRSESFMMHKDEGKGDDDEDNDDDDN